MFELLNVLQSSLLQRARATGVVRSPVAPVASHLMHLHTQFITSSPLVENPRGYFCESGLFLALQASRRGSLYIYPWAARSRHSSCSRSVSHILPHSLVLSTRVFNPTFHSCSRSISIPDTHASTYFHRRILLPRPCRWSFVLPFLFPEEGEYPNHFDRAILIILVGLKKTLS